jgi:hypothetical protein
MLSADSKGQWFNKKVHGVISGDISEKFIMLVEMRKYMT